MKTIICGAGDVGYSIADKLSKENFEVTVVDESEERLLKVSENLDVKTVNGIPSLPSVLLDAGAKECVSNSQFHEITCEMKDFYKVKNMVEEKVDQLSYYAIEWRSYNNIELSEDNKSKALIMLNNLDEIEDVQNIYINCKF